MTPAVAGSIVFFTSGAVLILEVLAVRLLAPYVGVTLESYTAIIATVLAGISLGTWLGGYMADRVSPRQMLGPLMVGGGLLSLAAIPLARLVGDGLAATGSQSVMTLSVVSFFAPAAVLSAVNPTVVKLQLRDLAVTGQVVGRLSALGTAGAILGTVVAGFVLVEAAPTTTSILVIGAVLVAAGSGLWVWLSRPSGRTMASVVLTALLSSGLAVTAGDLCDRETVYHCARIVQDGERPSARVLVLDTLRHSYVDLKDPTYLGFRYTKVFADLVGATTSAGPLDVLHVGGGGFTLPSYLRATRPGSQSIVLEIDPGLVELSQERLGLRTGPDLDVRVGDARMLVDQIPDASQDVVLGDAFGGLAVPWHLTTVEFAQDLARTLRGGGIYILNLIDHPPLRFARAEVATLAQVFDHVAVTAPAAILDGRGGGNVVLAASDEPIDPRRISAAISARRGEESVLVDAEALAFSQGAEPLTDDHAPVDQWLARARRE